MEDILNLVDEFIQSQKSLNQTSKSSPYYEIIKIHSLETKNKIKKLLSTQKQEIFYNYIIQQKKLSKSNILEDDVIDFGKIQIDEINDLYDLKIWFMISTKNAINATFDITKKQIDLMILNNNKMIKKLSKISQNLTNLKCDMCGISKTYDAEKSKQLAQDDIEDLIYFQKIKIELYEYIYPILTN